MRTILPNIKTNPTKDVFDTGFDRLMKRGRGASDNVDINELFYAKSALLNTLEATDNAVDTSKSKGIVIPAPTATDNFTFFPLPLTKSITISRLRAVWYSEAGAPSATWTIRFAENRNATGTEIIVGGTTTTSLTGGDDLTALDNAVIPANNWIWIQITAIGTIAATDNLSVFAFYE